MSEECRLFIGNLPAEATKDTLRSVIAEDINIDVHIPARWRRRAARYAFVAFRGEEEMNRAVEQLEKAFHGDDKLVISPAEPQSKQKQKQRQKQRQKQKQRKQKQKQVEADGQVEADKPVENKSDKETEKEAEKEAENQANEPSKDAGTSTEQKPASKRPHKRRLRPSESKLVPADGYVYVELAPKTKASHVDELFSNAGFTNHKARVVVRPRRVTRRAGEKVVIPPKVFAFVWVGTDATQKAIDELSGKEINGSKIEVRPATSRVPLDTSGVIPNGDAAEEKPEKTE